MGVGSGTEEQSAGFDTADVIGRRVGAALLDLVVLFVLLILVGLAFGKGHAHGSSFSVTLSGASAVVYFILLALYYFVPEAIAGQTLGKRLLAIKVARLDGSPAGAGSIAARTLLRVIDALPLAYLLGFVVMLATGPNRRQRIGDLAARTTVVNA